MADAIVLATAQVYEAEVVTSDSDFDGVPELTYIPKKRRAIAPTGDLCLRSATASTRILSTHRPAA